MTGKLKLIAVPVRVGTIRPDDRDVVNVDVRVGDTREAVMSRALSQFPAGHSLGELFIINDAGIFCGSLWMNGPEYGWTPDAEARIRELASQGSPVN